MAEGFRFQGTGKLARIDTFTTKNGKTILTLVFHQDGQYPQWIPIKVFGRLAEMVSDLQPGDIVEVSGELGGREWNGKVFGDATGRTVEVVSQGSGQHREEHAGGKRQGWGDENRRAAEESGFQGSPNPSDDDVPF